MYHSFSSGTSMDGVLCLLVVGSVFTRVTLSVSVSRLGGWFPREGLWSAQRSHQQGAAPVGKPSLVDGAGGGRVQPPPLVRPRSFQCCPCPPLLGAGSHMACLQCLRLLGVSAVSLPCAALGFIPGDVQGGATRVTSHTHRTISSGSSETFLFQDPFIFSPAGAKRPSVYVG